MVTSGIERQCSGNVSVMGRLVEQKLSFPSTIMQISVENNSSQQTLIAVSHGR